MNCIEQKTGNEWAMYNGDCIEVMRGLPDNSIDFSVYSPPFSSLYSYSNSLHDMGNSKNDDDFFQHYGFLIAEHMRTMKPGRLVAVHCMNLPTSKQNHGFIGLRDFRGGVIEAFQRAGFIYHAEVCIWKCPVVAVTRTKALGLLHKQLKKDSAMSRTGIPDYVVVFRKPGANTDPISNTNDTFPVDEWQKVASPIWMDIKQTKVLKYTHARENDDTRHICPLQLEVIERCLKLWSKSGDVVMSPFAGIGSEGAVSIAMGRRFIGIELKKAYFDVAVGNLENPLEPVAIIDNISEDALSESTHWDYARLCKERDDLTTRIKTIDRTR
jgi:DNA modification methylase